MSSLLDHLGRDTLPRPLLEAFIHWCVWEQARPAIVEVLQETAMTDLAEQIAAASDLSTLEMLGEHAGNLAHEARRSTGPLGLSTAEAAAFLTSKLARAAQEEHWDPEDVSFFSIQVCGWAGFAQTGFTNPTVKIKAEEAARARQETQLRAMWKQFGSGS